MTEIAQYFQTQTQLIEQRLEQLIPSSYRQNHTLFEAARYMLLGGGKRLRPILTLATTQILGGPLEAALTPACTLELIHTYSMIHDDLPCMDNDDYRRGKLTLHKKYNEGHAVLTGDYLLTYTFEILATLSHLSAEKKVQLISTLARRSGANGMIGGQVMDLAYEEQRINLDTLRLLHYNKTASLLIASIEFGGILSDATPFEMEQLRLFGEHIGLAFQIIDDILDVTSSQAKHGRLIGSDVANHKSTYVTLLGLEQAEAYAKEAYTKALMHLKQLPYPTTLLVQIADFIVNRNH